jgi:hypothetical protein
MVKSYFSWFNRNFAWLFPGISQVFPGISSFLPRIRHIPKGTIAAKAVAFALLCFVPILLLRCRRVRFGKPSEGDMMEI